ncbi:hypothetical protein B0H10DRAFT_1944499 [Mycena sp. CBHHK59/15]|nr:hypothetical protein B0H10DRAFT_1944499 [Mycena sp. CBHHK59/15]
MTALLAIHVMRRVGCRLSVYGYGRIFDGSFGVNLSCVQINSNSLTGKEVAVIRQYGHTIAPEEAHMPVTEMFGAEIQTRRSCVKPSDSPENWQHTMGNIGIESGLEFENSLRLDSVLNGLPPDHPEYVFPATFHIQFFLPRVIEQEELAQCKILSQNGVKITD